MALHGPPISVGCPCGQRAKLAYGDVWTCPDCGLRWNTNQIDRGEYRALHRIQLRFRLVPILLGALIGGLALFFLFTHNTYSLFLLIPFALIGWMSGLRPAVRRRYRSAIADRPTWELRPERDGAA